MQGRLLPKYKGRYQSHPLGYWQEEFPIAKALGLNLIEFILDYEDYNLNPLLSVEGQKEIISISAKYNVQVKSICADYFMKSPLHSHDDLKVEESLEVLKKLIDSSLNLKIENIVIPCVDESSIKEKGKLDRFIEVLSDMTKIAEKKNINLSLETDLDPFDFSYLLSKLDSTSIKVNYDIGNSASLGYKPDEEFSAYGSKISDLHIKDRILGGGSVPLGEGDANIKKCLQLLEQYDFAGPYIMQAFRDDEGLLVFKKQLEWLRQL